MLMIMTHSASPRAVEDDIFSSKHTIEKGNYTEI